MKGRIFQYTKYKAWNEGIITSRINPRNTSRECARCQGFLIRYAQGQPIEGYTPGAPLVLCPQCAMRGHADRNASLVIGQRLVARYQQANQEKPPTPLLSQVVEELRALGRLDISYSVFVEVNGTTFLHLLFCANDEAEQVFFRLPSQQAFQAGLAASHLEVPPTMTTLRLVGATSDLV